MADTAREHLKHEHRWDLSMTILDEVIAGARSGHPLPVTT
jgi:hypothetical protein